MNSRAPIVSAKHSTTVMIDGELVEFEETSVAVHTEPERPPLVAWRGKPRDIPIYRIDMTRYRWRLTSRWPFVERVRGVLTRVR